MVAVNEAWAVTYRIGGAIDVMRLVDVDEWNRQVMLKGEGVLVGVLEVAATMDQANASKVKWGQKKREAARER